MEKLTFEYNLLY